MTWELEFISTTPDGSKRVEYETLDALGYSRAERPDRVKVSGKVVHRGFTCDGQGFKLYKRLTARPDAHPRRWPNYIDTPEWNDDHE